MCGPRSGSRARNRVRHPRMTSRGSAGRGAVRGGSRHAGRAGATARCRGGSPARSGGWRGCGEPTAWWPALPARRCPGPGPPAGSSRPARYFPDDPASAPPRPAAAGRAGSRWRTGLPRQDPRPTAPPARRAASKTPRGGPHKDGAGSPLVASTSKAASSFTRARIRRSSPRSRSRSRSMSSIQARGSATGQRVFQPARGLSDGPGKYRAQVVARAEAWLARWLAGSRPLPDWPAGTSAPVDAPSAPARTRPALVGGQTPKPAGSPRHAGQGANTRRRASAVMWAARRLCHRRRRRKRGLLATRGTRQRPAGLSQGAAQPARMTSLRSKAASRRERPSRGSPAGDAVHLVYPEPYPHPAWLLLSADRAGRVDRLADAGFRPRARCLGRGRGRSFGPGNDVTEGDGSDERNG